MSGRIVTAILEQDKQGLQRILTDKETSLDDIYEALDDLSYLKGRGHKMFEMTCFFVYLCQPVATQDL